MRKIVRRWLLPILTCLIAAAAAVLPPHLSRARDAGLLDGVHTEEAAGDSLSPEETTLSERIRLLARWAGDDGIVSLSLPFSEEELERDLRPFIDGSFRLFCQSVPVIGRNVEQAEADFTAGRLLLRDTESGLSASLIQVRGKTGVLGEAGTEEMLIDEQTGLVLSFRFSGWLESIYYLYEPHDGRRFDGEAAAEWAKSYLDYLGLDGELTTWDWTLGSGAEARAFFRLGDCGAGYTFLLVSDSKGVTACVGPDENG